MAKKRKVKDAEDDSVFKMPEFDRAEFVRNEIRDSKIILVTLVYAILFATIGHGASQIHPILALVFAGVGLYTLRFIYTHVKIDITELEPKKWVGFCGLFFFCWLAFWIIISNPPLSDSASPKASVELLVQYDANSTYNVTVDWMDVNESMDIRIHAFVRDSSDIESVHLTIFHTQIEIANISMKMGEEKHYYHDITTQPGVYKLVIRSEDSHGNENVWSREFEAKTITT